MEQVKTTVPDGQYVFSYKNFSQLDFEIEDIGFFDDDIDLIQYVIFRGEIVGTKVVLCDDSILVDHSAISYALLDDLYETYDGGDD